MEPPVTDFSQIAVLAHCIHLLRSHEKGRELEHWMEAAAFWRKQLSDPLTCRLRCRPR